MKEALDFLLDIKSKTLNLNYYSDCYMDAYREASLCIVTYIARLLLGE